MKNCFLIKMSFFNENTSFENLEILEISKKQIIYEKAYPYVNQQNI